MQMPTRVAALIIAPWLLLTNSPVAAQISDYGEEEAALVFQILASELAIAQGEVGIAAATYLNIARLTGDAQAAKRATELFIQARIPRQAEQAGELWLSLAPTDAEARGTLDLLYVMLSRQDKLLQTLADRRIAAVLSGQLDAFYDYVAGLAGRAPNREEGALLFERVTEADERKPSVLYSRAMLRERMGDYALMEQLLRRIIEIDPSHAHAYNALGYHFADRNERLDEALELIRKALSLMPKDAHIIDSMGWIQFRRGDLAQAERYLRQAHSLRADAEIATHLGEVLWVRGNQTEAKIFWRAAFEADPGNEVLINTLKRLGVPSSEAHP